MELNRTGDFSEASLVELFEFISYLVTYAFPDNLENGGVLKLLERIEELKES